MTYKVYFVFFFISSLTMSSCFGGGQKIPPINLPEALGEDDLSPEAKSVIKNRCIQDRFADGSDDTLYGIDCIEGKHLLIQTSKEGDMVSTSHAINKEKGTSGLRLEEKLSFINKFYSPKYSILKNKGDDKKIPFLLDFLPEDEQLRFFGSLNKKYRIIFEIWGNYLVLFKASKDLNDLPYTERTSAVQSKDGKFHMVPFLGYSIKYCKPQFQINSIGQKMQISRANCQANLSLKDAKYISIQTDPKKVYEHHLANKKDLFPAKYFEGQWFFASGPIETQSSAGHLAPTRAFLVEMQKQSDHLKVVDVSGDVEERNRLVFEEKIPVQWVEYEMARDGETFERFEEREYTGTEAIERPYLKIDFPKMIGEGKEIIDLLVTNDYFSYVFEQPTSRGEHTQKFKVSFLRKKAVDTQGFISRRWFKDDHDHVFGILPTRPQDEKKLAEYTEEEHFSHFRMIRFNTHLNSPQEQKEKTKIIKWHFSKNSTKDKYYRDTAREAVRLWNRAFEVITRNSDKKIKVELAEEEGDKDLGDLRYNIINLIEAKDLSGLGGNLFGMAPSYAHSNTGQIIGTTANIVIHNLLESYHKEVRNYIRYELFQKDKKTMEENNIHVVNPYFRHKIANQCPEVRQFIVDRIQKQKQGELKLKRRDNLGDRDIILSCGKQLIKDRLLTLTLHETGHSFGLGHNFKASVDKDNYYQSPEELKQYFPEAQISLEKLSKTSSVMDYLPRGVPPMSYPGKYDLAALGYLYMDQVEARDGRFLPLNISPEISKQEPLSKSVLSQRKNYSHCSDWVTQKEDFLCIRHDYGSNPLEIVTHYIEEFKRGLNARHLYDGFSENPDVLSIPLENLIKIAFFHTKWIQLRDEYLQSRNQFEKANYSINKPSSIDEYKKAIAEGTKTNTEYKRYYALRSVVSQFMLDLFFLETMKCNVRDNKDKTYTLDLETIKSHLVAVYEDKLYVEDCYSPMITDFLKKNDLTLQDQTGIEGSGSYYSKGINRKMDLISLPMLLTSIFQLPHIFLFYWTSEPDFFEAFRLRLEKAVLNKEDHGKSPFDFHKVHRQLYHNFIVYMSANLKNPEANSATLRNNISHLTSAPFRNGTGPASFYQLVEMPLSTGWTIDQMGIPFLVKAHTDFKKELNKEDNKYSNFEQYLRGRKDTITDKANKGLIIPFKTGSLSRKMILKYNKNLRKIRSLDKLEQQNSDLSFSEKMSRLTMKWHNEVLKDTILTITPNNE